jgi:hypothetical protein
MGNITIFASATIEAAASGKPRRFKVDAYNGGALLVEGFHLPIVPDLAGMVADEQIVANLDHRSDKRVGHVDRVHNDGRRLQLEGIVSAATRSAREFVDSAQGGFPWAASIEAAPSSIEEIPRGKIATANGRSFQGPVLIARQSRLIGIAFLSKGADSQARAMLANRGVNRMSDFTQWAADMGMDISMMTDAQLANLHANFSGRDSATADDRAAVAPLIHASGDPVECESRRLRQIDRATSGDWGDQSAHVAELKAQAVSGKLSVDELLAEVRQIRGEQLEASIPMAHTVYARRDNEPAVIEAAFCLAGGLTNPDRYFSEQVLEAADRMARTASLQQTIMAEAVRNGYPASAGERITQGNLRPVLHAAFAPQIRAGGFSTTSLPTTLGNIANKFLRDGFMSVDQTALRISAVKPVRDFKTHTTISLTGGLAFSQVGPDGELKHGTVGETTYTNKADTYGVMFAITRTDIINDDTDALTAVPRRIGRGGMLKLNDLVWRKFLDNSAFFTAGNKNVSTGAGSALSLDGLAAAEKVFINQTDPDGNPLGTMPAILLVPPTLKSKALELMNSQLVVTGASSTLPNANVWQGRFSVECSPYMENSGYTGNSAAAWYLLAAPNQLPVIEIAALNGRVEPTVETADADFNVLGIQMRGYSDVGVALQEFRAAVRSAGS